MPERPHDNEVGQVLERVLKSAVFSKSRRARTLLEYLVNEDLKGNGENLKGFVIAMDVFGKDESFDATSDPLVRVHVGRLRELLDTYFKGEGADEPLRIGVPVGSYRPVYSLPEKKAAVANGKAETGERKPAPREAPSPPQQLQTAAAGGGHAAAIPADAPVRMTNQGIPELVQRHMRLYWVALAFIFLALAALIGLLLYQNSLIRQSELMEKSAADAVSLPTVSIFYEDDQEDIRLFAERLSTLLSKFDTVTTRPPGLLPDPDETEWGKTDYGVRLTGSGNDPETGELLVKVEVRSMYDDQVLRAETYPVNVWDKPGIRELASGKLSALAVPEGLIYADLLQRDHVDFDLSCLLKVRRYYLLRNEETHRNAYLCTEEAVIENKTQLGLLHGLFASMIVENESRKWAWFAESGKKTLTSQDALQYALNGVELWPSSGRTAREVGYIYSRIGNAELMNDWFTRAYNLNPADTSIAASYGFGALLSANYRQAARALSGAIKASPRHPPWWDYYYSLSLLMLDDVAGASDAASALDVSRKNSFYKALDVVLAHERGDFAEADKLFKLLENDYPKFARDPRGYFSKRNYPVDLMEYLVEGLTQRSKTSEKQGAIQ